MANYYANARTNYFRVTDEKKYQELFGELTAEDDIKDFSGEIDGVMCHGFGAYSSIEYKHLETYSEFMTRCPDMKKAVTLEVYVDGEETDLPDEELNGFFVGSVSGTAENPVIELVKNRDDAEGEWESIEGFIKKLQPLLPEDEAFIYQESGYEKLRYITGYALVATRDKVECVDITSGAVELARKMLNNPDFKTQLEY